MATEQELGDALKQTLQRSGALDAVRARLRAEVYTALADGDTPPPRMTREQLM